MSLVKSHILTPAKLAANRANARLSTGPRTAEGKRRIVLNALKHGRYSRAFRQNLIKTRADVELFDWIHARIVDCFEPRNAAQSWQAERLAREVWCQTWQDQRADRLARAEHARRSHELEVPHRACRMDQRDGSRLRRRPSRAPDKVSLWSLAWTPWRRGGLESKPRYALQSTDSAVTSLSRIRIENPRSGRRLAFWVRRRRGTAPSQIPLAAYPEIMAWLLQQQQEFAAAQQAASRTG
jgi:hypothetical protein